MYNLLDVYGSIVGRDPSFAQCGNVGKDDEVYLIAIMKSRKPSYSRGETKPE
jgi:hypothetical protein